MAVWTWMRYSYAWPTTPKALAQAGPEADGAYAQVSGLVQRGAAYQPLDFWQHYHDLYVDESTDRFTVWESEELSSKYVVCWDVKGKTEAEGGRMSLVGRIDFARFDDRAVGGPTMLVDASRFHPASVAGLVVAAFGTLVFALYLRRWIVERRAGGRPATRPWA
jgi:hypothetical protein